MELLLEHAVDDHKMSTYRSVLKSITYRLKNESIKKNEPVNLQSIYLSMASEKILPSFHNQILTKQSISKEKNDDNNILKSDLSLSEIQWKNCSVCGLDTTW